MQHMRRRRQIRSRGQGGEESWTVDVLLKEQMPHMRDGLARARSAGPVGIHAAHIPAVCVHVTKPRLKAVADRCCDRHNPLNHLARAIGLQEHTYRVVRDRSCLQKRTGAHWSIDATSSLLRER